MKQQNRIPQVGEHMVLPSGNMVEIQRLTDARLLTWHCVYVGPAWGGRSTTNPKRRELNLRDDWLGRWGRLVCL
jgi:hypothetical protein